MISFTVPLLKKILKSKESLEDKCKNVRIQKDINNFIEKNKSNMKPDEKIKFVLYFRQASFDISGYSANDKKDLENLDINYNIISILHEILGI